MSLHFLSPAQVQLAQEFKHYRIQIHSYSIPHRSIARYGITIPKDVLLYLMFSSANHDEAFFAHGYTFDPDREHLNRYLAFSYGIHNSEHTRLGG